MRAYFQWMECIARKQFVRFWTLELILIQTSNSFFAVPKVVLFYSKYL